MRIHLILFLAVSALSALSATALGQPGCPSGQRSCTREDGRPRCTDTRTDEANCGGCGNVCRKQDRCIDGRCVGDRGGDRCEGGFSSCMREDGRPRCTDTRTDEANCGGCGNVCRKQDRCIDGRCVGDRGGDRCEGGFSSCMREDGRPRCTDTRTDEANCGRCGNVCRKQDRCIDGRCVGDRGGDRCEGGFSSCMREDGRPRCTDTRTDEANCGRCGNVCQKPERCTNGVCSRDCPSGRTFCPQLQDGRPGCTDARTDPYNCGGCGQVCPSVRRRCREGVCS